MISFGEYSVGEWQQTSRYRHVRPVYKQGKLCLLIVITQQLYTNENLHALYFNNYSLNENNLEDIVYFYDRYRLFYGLNMSYYNIDFQSLDGGKAMVDNFLLKFNKLKMFI